jgi:hypothetical protein
LRNLLLKLGMVLLVAVGLYSTAVAFRLTRIPFNQIETTMSITTSLDGRILTMSGTTNLSDGAVVVCEAWHESEDHGLGPSRYIAGDDAVVASGTFVCRADLTGWPSGTVRADARFVPYDDQPKDVVERYGEFGERLGGPRVFQDSDGWVLHIRKNVPLAAIESRSAA